MIYIFAFISFNITFNLSYIHHIFQALKQIIIFVLKRYRKSNNLIIFRLYLIHLLRILILKLLSSIIIVIICQYIHWKWLRNDRTCHIFVWIEATIGNYFGYCSHLQNILLLKITILRVLIILVIISLVVLLLIVILYFVVILL